jgi:hypothetical protein
MKPRGFFLLALLLCLGTPLMANADRTFEADRLADKLWRVIDITKQYQPQFQAHVTLEAPDGERLALTFQRESARTLVSHDIIELERTREIPADIPDEALGAYFIPRHAKLGKPRWWGERAEHAGQEIKKGWTLFLLQHRGRGTAL